MNNSYFTAQHATESGAFKCAQSWQNFVEKMKTEGKKPSVLALNLARKKIPNFSGEITV